MSPHRQEQDGADALVAATEFLGLDVRIESRSGGDRGHDISVVLPDGGSIDFAIKSASLVTGDSASGHLQRWASDTENDVAVLIVADRITADGRDRLNRAGWSWLDLRGHLKLVGPGLFVDADVPTLSEPGSERSGLIGRVGIELAALLLLDPTARIGVRAAAMMLARSPSSISDAFAAMRAGDLVDANRVPAVPELFWELAEHWKSASRDVKSLPTHLRSRDDVALHLGIDDIESTVGWALTDTLAAAIYGAPVSMRIGHPPDFYVPDRSVLRRAVQLLGPAATPSTRAGRIRVAPVPLVCARRVDATGWANEVWPLVNPLFVALDLAQDPGRGREILDGWTPGKPWNRVW